MQVCRSSSLWCLYVAVLLLAATASLFAVDVNSLPKPTGYVSDLAHVIDPSAKDELEKLCTDVEQQLGVQIALVTIDSIGDRPIRDFALDLSRRWGVGDRKTNQGVLLLLAVKDRKSDIETGRGIEPYLTDGFSGSTLRAMRPELQGGNYGAALLTATRTMAAQIAQGKGIAFAPEGLPPPEQPVRRERGGGGAGLLIFLGIFFLIWLFGRSGRGGRGGRWGGGGGGGFWTGMLLGNLLSSGRRDYGGGSWGSSGGFGGGDSGGGGGFGGFGGGDFGGGGASSDW
jgi:uncharacterized protein